jgi:glycosyltransferase involved in cell wall biosynthesis
MQPAIDRVDDAHTNRRARRSVTSMPSIAVIMPAYNEASRIEAAIQSVARYRTAGARIGPVVVADDGSTDGTRDVALAAARREGIELEVLDLPHRGKASTVRSAMLELATRAGTDYLMMLDADDELRIDQLDGVAWSVDPRTVYIGRRVDSIGGVHGVRPTLLRRSMSTTMRAASRILLGIRYPDTQCGFKLFPTAVVEDLFGQQRSTGWTFDAEILFIADRVSKLPIQEVPVVWRPRGASRVRTGGVVVSAFAMFGTAGRRLLHAYHPVGTAGARTSVRTARRPRVIRPVAGENPASLATTKPTL